MLSESAAAGWETGCEYSVNELHARMNEQTRARCIRLEEQWVCIALDELPCRKCIEGSLFLNQFFKRSSLRDPTIFKHNDAVSPLNGT